MAKTLTDDLRHVDVRRLARDGLLVPGHSFGWEWRSEAAVVASIRLTIHDNAVTFDYRIGSGEERQQVHQRVRLLATPCTYGGQRLWFACPYCDKRAALLYIGRQVACRRCFGMAYRVQRESKHDREARRLDAIRDRLGWEPGFLNGDGWKPKGMHWRTYYRLKAEHDQLVLSVIGAMDARLDRAYERIARQQGGGDWLASVNCRGK
ncbi:hypothetical protein NH8B_0503 [Pseudogulbenkiania sp. NH8B]|uniref:hypothetical protein n=1 Tax=Pseudogulbenkiania sp. (strain NH8B) TaxID=748280 RepID=UPI000227946A|nr:hypothetical protein [Pseudogulbenkiania sp. NH8B]BAK75338.1 hypothetical protein NH8B_0503 [Pseudogulbenkiania sp. NH8B]